MTTTEHITTTVRGLVRHTLRFYEVRELEDAFAEQFEELLTARAKRITELERERDAWKAHAEHIDHCRQCGDGPPCDEGLRLRLEVAFEMEDPANDDRP